MKRLAVLKSLFSLLAALAFALTSCSNAQQVSSVSVDSSSQSEYDPLRSFFAYNEDKIDLACNRNLTMTAYASNDFVRGELVVNRGGADITVYRVEKQRVYNPIWSPNGKMIAFEVMERPGLGRCVYTYDLASRQIVKTGLTTSYDSVDDPECYISWSANSTKILAEGMPITYWEISTGKSTSIASKLDVDGDLIMLRAAFSQDGKKIAFSEMADYRKLAVKVFDCVSGEVKRMGEVPLLFTHGYDMQPPVWISDTEFLNIGMPEYRTVNLYKINSETGKVTEFIKNAWYAKLSPDGKKVLFDCDSEPGQAAGLLDLDTMKIIPVKGNSLSKSVWSPAGDRFVLRNMTNSGTEFHIIGLDGQQIGETIIENGKFITGVALTSDGLWYETIRPNE